MNPTRLRRWATREYAWRLLYPDHRRHCLIDRLVIHPILDLHAAIPGNRQDERLRRIIAAGGAGRSREDVTE